MFGSNIRNLLELAANGREFLQGEDSGGGKDLRRATKTGRPLIDHEHLASIEKKTGRNLQKGGTRTETAGFHEISDVSPDSRTRKFEWLNSCRDPNSECNIARPQIQNLPSTPQSTIKNN